MARDETWRADALCAQIGSDLFFPEPGDDAQLAKRICARCPVTAECLDYSISTRAWFGVWGGMAERRRRQLFDREKGAA